MKKMRLLIHTCMLLAMLAAMLPMQAAAAQPPAQDVDRSTPYVPGEVLIGFGSDVPAKQYLARADALAADVGAQVTRKYSNFAVLNFSADTDVFAMSQQLSAAAGVVVAQPNYVYWTPEDEHEVLGKALVAGGYSAKTTGGGEVAFTLDELAAMQSTYTGKATPVFPNELTAGNAWGWDAVQADLIWPDRTRNPEVCVLDTGVDYKHYDLSGKVVNGYDFYNGDKYSYDDNGHGTHVAGIISAKVNDRNLGTAVGVSAAKIRAVKVLNAQAMGTTFSVASGLVYCANISSVSVINMSFGSTVNDQMVYEALKYATLTKNKLVVAAAGNETSSTPLYPAAYSNVNYTSKDGYNSVHVAVMSVAAAAAPASSGSALQMWVDTNGNNQPDEDELHSPEECAYGGRADSGAYGTNYGDWVTIVAPGEDIYSDTPTSYPFYENYYGGVQPGYDYMSGSSMATAFVSGAAARAWYTQPHLYGGSPAFDLKDQLVESGSPLIYEVDKNISDASAGYNSGYTGSRTNPETGQALAYGVSYARTGSGPADTVMAPYCWPGWDDVAAPGGSWTDAQNMKKAPRNAPTYLNVAKAMGRGAALMEVKDATNGQDLPKTTVMAYEGKYLRDKAYTVQGNSRAILINLKAASGGTAFNLVINKSGYTSGNQTVNTVNVMPGEVNFDVYSVVSLPTKANINFVLDWVNPNANLDMYLRLPETGPFYPLTENGGIVGPAGNDKLTTYVPTLYDDIYMGPGTLQAPKYYIPMWTSTNPEKSPYAQYYFDGGLTSGADGAAQAFSPTETISVLKGAKYGYGYTDLGSKFTEYRPYYAPNGDYDLYVTDYSGSYGGFTQADGNGGEALRYLNVSSDDFVYPVVRVWQDGILVKTIKAEVGASCGNDNDWWQVMSIVAGTSDWSASSSAVNSCMDGTTTDPGDLLTYGP